MSEIQATFQGAHVFITGATGFMGQVLVEKLLRTCHQLERVYLIVRPKKGINEEERFKTIFDGYLYGPLKNEQPDFLKKVTLISGDFDKPGLGISEADRDILKQNVNFVFHVAATVRFDEKLHIASAVNVLATKNLMELSKEMYNLKAFIYISTAYANCPLREIDEKFYEPGMKSAEFLQLTNSMDEATLNAITPIPSIVVSTTKEPIQYWINNVYGAAGVAIGVAVGLIRVLRAHSTNVLDIIPVDMAIHCSIAAAWEVATTKPSSPKIYNYVSSAQRPITIGQYMYYLENSVIIPATICIWVNFLFLEGNRHLCNLLVLLLHTIPAIIADTAALILRKKPKLLRGYLKVHKFTEVLTFFTIQQWNFKNGNVLTLWDKLSRKDKSLFHFNIEELDWAEYLGYMLRGVRLYILGIQYDEKSIESGKTHFRRLKWIHFIVVKILQLLLALSIFFSAKYLYNNVIYPCIT
ncbi:Fatty acyl-CoA reductase wat [Blattella germanica]|nr:Fatty acyl-CoA reductase wat [Blattella germanica]